MGLVVFLLEGFVIELSGCGCGCGCGYKGEWGGKGVLIFLIFIKSEIFLDKSEGLSLIGESEKCANHKS